MFGYLAGKKERLIPDENQPFIPGSKKSFQSQERPYFVCNPG